MSLALNVGCVSENTVQCGLFYSGVAVIGEGGASSWMMIETEMDEDIALIEASSVAAAAAGDAEPVVVKTTEQSPVIVDSDSEEDIVDIVGSSKASSLPTKKINLTKAVKRKKHSKIKH